MVSKLTIKLDHLKIEDNNVDGLEISMEFEASPEELSKYIETTMKLIDRLLKTYPEGE